MDESVMTRDRSAEPAEEIGRGALAMMDDGLFDRVPKPDYTLALHVSSHVPAGRVALVAEWAFANVDSVDVILYGVGGHGARPHLTVDPIVASAHFITALQTLVSRRIDPLAPAVVTVGSIRAGAKHNDHGFANRPRFGQQNRADDTGKGCRQDHLLDGFRFCRPQSK